MKMRIAFRLDEFVSGFITGLLMAAMVLISMVLT